MVSLPAGRENATGDYTLVRSTMHMSLKQGITAVSAVTALFFGEVGSAPRETVLDDWLFQKDILSKELAGIFRSDRCEYKEGKTPDWREKAVEQALDSHVLIHPEDSDPLSVVLRRTNALLERLTEMQEYSKGPEFSAALRELENRAESGNRDELYLEACALRRQIVFSNPLLDFDTLLFNAYAANGRNSTTDHMQMEYRSDNALNGGGIYLLTNWKTDEFTLRDIFEGVEVAEGRLEGQTLEGGSFLGPELSFDGKVLYFSHAWKDRKRVNYPKDWREQEKWPDPEHFFQIYKMNIDGTDLVQLSDASQDDHHPCVLPGGRIAFTSNRRIAGGVRCNGGPMPSHVLYSMAGDGSDVIPLSYFETHEFHPSVDNDGKIVYSRWDYVDRNDEITCNLWVCNPDGTDPRAPHGNYPLPYTTVDTNSSLKPGDRVPGCVDGRLLHPYTEFNIRAVPDLPGRYVATVGPHHGFSFGALILIDTRIEDDDMMSQARRITIESGFPERMVKECPLNIPYGTAWPLNEDFYLCSYLDNVSVLDRFGNREAIIHRSEVPNTDTLSALQSSKAFRLVDPTPVRPRKTPPIIPAKTNMGDSRVAGRETAKISVSDCRISDLPLPEERTVKWLRIIHYLPRWYGSMDNPLVGYLLPDGGQSQQATRMPLGVVPVEDDGSAYFEAPVGRLLYFQLLDEDGLAIQSMRSATYVHPGEHLSCTGCHEDKWSATPAPASPKALKRDASRIRTEVDDGAVPFSYYRLVKEPVFDQKCLPCHNEKGKGPDFSFQSLMDYAFFYNNADGVHCKAWIGGSRTVPGMFGARVSRLYRILTSTHKERVSLNEDEMKRITLWLDCLSPELGVYPPDLAQRQRAGEIVWPHYLADVDSTNPMGYEIPCDTCPHTAVSSVPTASSRIRTASVRAARGVVHVSVPRTCRSVTVMDLFGRRIAHQQIQPGQRSVAIETRGRSGGMAIVHFSLSTGSIQKKAMFLN